MRLEKIYLTQSRKDAKKITNIIIYLGALASLRENKQFPFRSDRLSFYRRPRAYAGMLGSNAMGSWNYGIAFKSTLTTKTSW